MATAKQALENESPPPPPHCWIYPECTLVTRSCCLLLRLKLLRHGHPLHLGSHGGRGQPGSREAVGKDVDQRGLLGLLDALLMVMEGRDHEASRSRAFIGGDAMVSNLIPGTCEVSGIMASCEASGIMAGYEVSGIMAGCEVWLTTRYQVHALFPLLLSPRLDPCSLLLLFSLPLGSILVPYYCRNRCHSLYRKHGSRRGGSDTKDLGGRGHWCSGLLRQCSAHEVSRARLRRIWLRKATRNHVDNR
uniref:Uncharacterized protein n=1 Tax=Oryza barthii TaxID=65489 RepID=A0A0D3FG81_9ORYZ